MQNSVIIGILFKLLRNRKMTAGELARYFEVSERTIFRYLDVLESAGVPLERTFGKLGGISIMNSFRLGHTYFTADERLRLVNSLKIASSSYNDNLSDSVLDKLMALSSRDNEDTYLLMTDTLVIDASGWNDAEQYRHKISAVNEGIFNNKLLLIRYRSRTDLTERLIEPHTLVLKEGVFYLYAYCHTREDFRIFMLSRINSVAVRDETFTRRKIEGLPWNNAFNSEEGITITLECTERALPDVEEWLGTTNQIEEGKYQITATIRPDDFSIKKILGLGAEVRLLSPTSLIEKIKAHAQAIASQY